MEKTYTKQASSGPTSYSLPLNVQGSSQLRDSIPLFILIVIGVVGVFYVLQNSSESAHSNAQAVSYFTSNTLAEEHLTTMGETESKNGVHHKTPIATQVKVRGVLEAKERLTFKIDNYDPAFVYSIDFGNGTSRVFNKKRVSYIYPESGTFVVKIMAENLAGIRQNVYSKLISIDKAINVYDNAHLERMN